MTASTVAGPVTGPAVRTAVVPWRETVLPLTLLLAAADQFWIVALRTGVGAVERTSDPAVSWLRETLLLLPAYAVGVVVGLGLAHRMFRGRTVGAGPVGGAIALVAGAVTVIGALLLLASSLVDYRLQASALVHHSEVHRGCWGACLAAREQASLDLQLKAVVVGTALLLATNLVLLGWAVALRGRPLQLVGSRAGASPRERIDDQRLLLAGLLVAAAAVHAAVVPEHLREWPLAGLFFVLVVGVQLLGAALVRHRATRAVLVSITAGSCGLVLLWAWTRTVGLPFGPGEGAAEAVGLADLAAGALEVAAALTCLVLLRARGASARPRRSVHARGAALAALAAVAALGVGGSGLPGLELLAGVAGAHDVSAAPGSTGD